MGNSEMPKTAKRQVRVLFGNHVDTITRVFARSIERGLQEKYTFAFRSCCTYDEITECSQEEKYDVFIIILNNVMRPSCLDDPRNRKNIMLNLIRSLKTGKDASVIALWGWNFEDPKIGEKARKAGADFCSPIPLDLKDLAKAVETCLQKNSENPAIAIEKKKSFFESLLRFFQNMMDN